MNGRLYDPVIGRFFSPDPYVPDAGSTQDFNRYPYARNNPLMYTDPDGEMPLLLIAAIGAAINAASYTAQVAMSDGGFSNWDKGQFWKSVGIGAVSSVIGAGVGGIVSSLGTGIGMSTGLAGITGSTLGGAASGFSSALLTGGNIGQSMLFGVAGGLLGGIVNTSISDMGFWARGGISVASGGITGGGLSALSGGDFWEGFRDGAIGAAAGFLGNELGKYIQQCKAEERFMRNKLGLSKEDVRALKKYGIGKINLREYSDPNGELWQSLKSEGHTELEGIFEKLRSRDYDSENGIIKAGRMHIRRNTEPMVKNGAYGFSQTDTYGTRINVHYDKFDVVLFPVTHFIFDSIYQLFLGVK